MFQRLQEVILKLGLVRGEIRCKRSQINSQLLVKMEFGGKIDDCCPVRCFQRGICVLALIRKHFISELCIIAVESGSDYRRNKMINDHRVAPTLRLIALAKSVHHIRIHDRHVANHDCGPIVPREPELLAWQPLLCAVPPKMNDRISLILFLEPEIECYVLVVRG